MKASKIDKHPNFPLMRQTDGQSVYHLQMPRWLFSDPRYMDMGLEAKMVYTFLLNRFRLSCRNGWTNDRGEVFVIFPRKELARELRICEQRVTAAFRSLVERKLIWEKRCGLGRANQIYIARVLPTSDFASAGVSSSPKDNAPAEIVDSKALTEQGCSKVSQELRDPSFKNRESCGSRTAGSEAPEPQIPRPSNIDKRNIDLSYIEVSPSVSVGDPWNTERRTACPAAAALWSTGLTAGIFRAVLEAIAWRAEQYGPRGSPCRNFNKPVHPRQLRSFCVNISQIFPVKWA